MFVAEGYKTSFTEVGLDCFQALYTDPANSPGLLFCGSTAAFANPKPPLGGSRPSRHGTWLASLPTGECPFSVTTAGISGCLLACCQMPSLLSLQASRLPVAEGNMDERCLPALTRQRHHASAYESHGRHERCYLVNHAASYSHRQPGQHGSVRPLSILYSHRGVSNFQYPIHL